MQECNFEHFPQLLLLACEIFSNEQWGYQKHFQWIIMLLNVDSYRFTPHHLHFYLGRATSTISLMERSHLQAESMVKSVCHPRIVCSLVEHLTDVLQTFYPFLNLQECHCRCWNQIVPDQIRWSNSLHHTGPLGQYWRTLCSFSSVPVNFGHSTLIYLSSMHPITCGIFQTSSNFLEISSHSPLLPEGVK